MLCHGCLNISRTQFSPRGGMSNLRVKATWKMTTITRNLPWFIKDLGLSIVGEVRYISQNELPSLAKIRSTSEMLRISSGKSPPSRHRLLKASYLKSTWNRDRDWRIYHEITSTVTHHLSPFRSWIVLACVRTGNTSLRDNLLLFL